jgi:hypothetical protein
VLTQTSIELIELTVDQLNLVLADDRITDIKSISGKNQLIVGCSDGFYRQIGFINGAIKWMDSW